jgi:cell division protein FtsI/penicillin-binding protein 2
LRASLQRRTRRALRRLTTRCAVGLVAVALSSCTAADSPAGPPPAEPVADRFIAAWNAVDESSMAALAGRRSRFALRMRHLLRSARRQGALRSWTVERTGAATEAPQDGDAASARVPYAVTYSSAASAQRVRLEGSFGLRLDAGRQKWRVLWRRAMLWPGIPGARRYHVKVRWPRRAAILDRKQRLLAHGPAKQRNYPFGAVAGSVVGHVGAVRSEDAGPWKLAGDVAGASGLEGAYERRLAGRPATRLVVLGRRRRVVETLGHRRGRPGAPVRATLDAVVQRNAERALAGTLGAAVVLAPRSGDLLAAASSGPFDPGNYVGATGVAPFNRALSGLYPPGSSAKVVTASAALEEDVVTPRTTLRGPPSYKGVRNFESGTFGEIDFAAAVRDSVNTAFAQVAERLGAGRLTRYAHAFGFGQPPAMTLGAATSSWPRPRDDYDLRWSSIGQAQVLATPLEMASVSATIANDGTRMEPRATFHDEKAGARVVSPRTAATMTLLMSSVVDAGTGTAASVPGLQVAGKTGTAEVDVDGERRNHAWFICFAPAQDPVVAVAVVAEYGGVGGEVAAPLARRVLEAVLPVL